MEPPPAEYSPISKIALESSAYPEGIKPTLQSQVHSLLAQCQHNSLICLRKSLPEDIPELQKLQNQWFPLCYTKEFYNNILNHLTQCIVAEVTLTHPKAVDSQESEKITKVIVGALVFQFTSSDGKITSSRWLGNLLRAEDDSIYIMTLGVVDEFRRLGVAKQLLAELMRIALETESVRFVYLHVVEYNQTATKFYLRNGMQVLQTLPDFYHIRGKRYAGKLIGKLLKGSKLKEGWLAWLKRILNILV